MLPDPTQFFANFVQSLPPLPFMAGGSPMGVSERNAARINAVPAYETRKISDAMKSQVADISVTGDTIFY